MEINEPIFLGLDLPGLISLPTMLALFVFAVWFGMTKCSKGIEAEGQAPQPGAPNDL